MPKCAACNESAPSNPPCPHGLCGRCCTRAPPCSDAVHCKPRKTIRGKRGQKAQAAKIRCWKEAYRLCRPLLKQQRTQIICQVLGVSVAQLRAATLRSLLTQAREEISQQSAGPMDVSADMSTELSVALLAPPTQTQRVVDEMLGSADLRHFIEQGDFHTPYWLGSATWSDDEQEEETSCVAS